MKKTIFATLLVLCLFLSACATAPAATKNIDSPQAATQVAEIVNPKPTAIPPTAPAAATVESASSTARLNTTYENAVSIEMQLLLGTFKLEGTENAISQAQAATLLPLWTNFKTLSQSIMPSRGEPGQGQANTTPEPPTIDTEAQAQLTALAGQIQAAMTPQQIQAISEMKITRETATAMMAEQGITMGGPQQNGQGGNGQPPEGTPPAGGPGAGQPPADGGQPPADGQQAGPSGNMPGGSFLPTELMDAFIKLLESKVG